MSRDPRPRAVAAGPEGALTGAQALALLEALPYPASLVDRNGVIVDRVGGSGAGPPDPLPAAFQERLEALTAAALASGVAESGEVTDPEGGSSWEISVAPVGTTEAIAVWRDRSELRRAEEALVEARRMEALGRLAGSVAHDFNNLLVGILGNAGLAKAELPADSPVRALVEQIELAGTRAAELTRQILRYSGGQDDDERSLVDLNALVAEIVELLRLALPRTATLTLEAATEPLLVEANPAQVRHLVMNLVMNARDALPDEGGAITLKTRSLGSTAGEPAAAGLEAGAYAVLEVADNGRGMDEATKERVFDLFFSTKGKGRGIGLAAAQDIVASHGGAIAVESAPGKGSTFMVLLPASADAAATAERPDASAAGWTGSGTVLVAEDDVSVREMLARVLPKWGLEPLFAADGREAIERIAEQGDSIACALLDLSLPKVSGAEVASRIAADRPDTPVVIMTGHEPAEVRERYPALRDTTLLPKSSFGLAKLRAALRDAIEGAAG